MTTHPTREPGWHNRDILRAVLLAAAVYVALRLLWFASDVFLLAFLGVLFGLAVGAGATRLERWRIPRGVGAALVAFSAIALLYVAGALSAPTLRTQGSELRERLPEAIDRVETWLNSHGALLGAPATPAPPPAGAPNAAVAADTGAKAGPQPISIRQRLGSELGGVTRYLFPFLSSTITILGGLLLILVTSIYIGADPDLYRNGIMHLIPHRGRERAGQVLTTMAVVLRRWLVTQLIAMIVIGVVSTIALLILHVRAPFVLGLIAGILEFVPTIGPIMSAVPAIAMGFLDSPEKALYVVIAYIVIQQLEGHILIPILMKEGMDLPPALTIIAQALMALVFGFLGLMVAVPLLAAVIAAVKILYVQRVVGDPVPATDAPADGLAAS